MDIKQVLSENLIAIDSIQAEKYPNLNHYFIKTNIREDLRGIIKTMQEYEFPIWADKYYLMSHTYIRTRIVERDGRKADGQGFQSHLFFLIDTGLVKRFIVTSGSDDPTLNTIWEYALAQCKQKGYSVPHAEQLLSVPLYDEKLLQQADKVAEMYRLRHINIRRITKKTIVDLRGKKTAQRIAPVVKVDWRINDRVSRLIISSIKRLIKENGYATRSGVFEMSKERMSGWMKFTPPDMNKQKDWTDAEKEEYKREKKCLQALNHVQSNFATFCRDHEFCYRQATREHIELFGLKGNMWIIVRSDEKERTGV